MTSSLNLAIFWSAAALCVVAQVAILRLLLGRQAYPSANDTPSATRPASVPDSAANARHTGRLIEAAWGLIPALALVALFIFTWREMHAPPTMEALPPAHAVPSASAELVQ